jgi:hypothetical protein
MKADLEIDANWRPQGDTPMHHTPPALRRCGFRRRLGAALQRGWQRLWMDERTLYLSRATGHADLERRLKTWETHRRQVMRVPYF